jgi:hypothetical protein
MRGLHARFNELLNFSEKFNLGEGWLGIALFDWIPVFFDTDFEEPVQLILENENPDKNSDTSNSWKTRVDLNFLLYIIVVIACAFAYNFTTYNNNVEGLEGFFTV